MTETVTGVRALRDLVNSAFQFWVFGAWLLAISFAIGCSQGPPTGRVRGKVTFKGKPVNEGLVTFINSKEGGAAEAYIDKDGSYAVKNPVPVADYQVVITPLVEIKDTDPGKSPPSPVEKAAPDIPRKYRTPGSSPLQASVKQGENEFPFEMTP
jgi:hypothetical protein